PEPEEAPLPSANAPLAPVRVSEEMLPPPTLSSHAESPKAPTENKKGPVPHPLENRNIPPPPVDPPKPLVATGKTPGGELSPPQPLPAVTPSAPVVAPPPPAPPAVTAKAPAPPPPKPLAAKPAEETAPTPDQDEEEKPASPVPPPESAHATPVKEVNAAELERANNWVARAAAPKQWEWPVKGPVVQQFGKKGGRTFTGIDIAANAGTPVRATADGVVSYAINGHQALGNLIILRHGGGFMTAYAHNAQILVKQGQKVRQGDQIATVGQSGEVDTPRLHFELRKRIKPLNPLTYLPKNSN
ncbi:MAG: M23 family metallopeptidase, partial [Magnetococcales bacterium]|nr:M23 family metallopeptidase [Magnetococcales bacterium]